MFWAETPDGLFVPLSAVCVIAAARSAQVLANLAAKALLNATGPVASEMSIAISVGTAESCVDDPVRDDWLQTGAWLSASNAT